jgi:hypothetical protein
VAVLAVLVALEGRPVNIIAAIFGFGLTVWLCQVHIHLTTPREARP